MANVGELVGIEPAPRAMFVYGSDDGLAEKAEDLAHRLRESIPTQRVLSNSDISDVHHAGFDLAFVFGNAPDFARHIYVVQFGGSYCGDMFGSDSMVEIRRVNSSVATQWKIGTTLDAEAELCNQDLLPLLPQGARVPATESGPTPIVVPTFRLVNGHGFSTPVAPWPKNDKRILVSDVDDNLYAVVYRRVINGPYHWVLPAQADAFKWAKFVLQFLNGYDIKRFPLRSSWSETPAYMTADETAASNALQEIQSRREQVLAELDQQEKQASATIDWARQTAESGPRKLVTESGEPLKQAVIAALSDLGFDVLDSDATAEKGNLLDDLQVRQVAGSVEVALAEVKGYVRGAKGNDLLSVQRYGMRYAAATGQVPERLWYVVNALIGRPPDDRDGPLAANREDVEQFGLSGGLVLGTEQLLELILRVERGELTKDAARDSLWSQTGYYRLP